MQTFEVSCLKNPESREGLLRLLRLLKGVSFFTAVSAHIVVAVNRTESRESLNPDLKE